MPRDLAGVVVLTGALILGVAGAPRSAVAAGTCKASYVVLGEFPRLTGSTPTEWFNVFGEGFASISSFTAATLTFSVPVIPWPTNESDPVLPDVTTYTVPMTAEQMKVGTKWSFRSRDAGVDRIVVHVSGDSCTATTLVDFSPVPATSTVAAIPRSSDQAPVVLLIVLIAGGGSVLALRWRLGSSS